MKHTSEMVFHKMIPIYLPDSKQC